MKDNDETICDLSNRSNCQKMGEKVLVHTLVGNSIKKQYFFKDLTDERKGIF